MELSVLGLTFSSGCVFLTLGWNTYRCINEARDCQDVQDFGVTNSGVYHITPIGTHRGFDAYCDMETDGGGWLVFQRRKDGSVDFTRNWIDYQFGFGNVSDEHWLGNQLLYMIVKQGFYELRVDLEDWEGNTAYAKYRMFYIGNSAENCRLTVAGYYGNAGICEQRQHTKQIKTTDTFENVRSSVRDYIEVRRIVGDGLDSSCIQRFLHDKKFLYNQNDVIITGKLLPSQFLKKGDSMKKNDGAQFATKDRDNTSLNCSAYYHAGWWFNDCFHALPNGLYVDGGDMTKYGMGIVWLHWKETFYYSLKGTEMKIRRK